MLREFKHYRLWLISVPVVALCGLFIGFAVVKARVGDWAQQWGVLSDGKTAVDIRAVDIWLVPMAGTILTFMYLGLLAMLKKAKNL